METLKNFKKILYNMTVFFLLISVSFVLPAQNKEVKISDNGNLVISSGTYFKVPGNITVGGGISGLLKTDGTNFETTGQLNLNAGSDLYLTSGTFTVGTVSINASSTVTYNGTDQDMKNWSYGNLVIDGNGIKSVTGDATTPTVCNNLTVNNTGNVLKIPENKALTVENTMINNAGENAVSVESSSLGDGSLISYSANVDATVNRFLTGTQWHYLSSPIDAAPLTLFNTNNFLWWDASIDWAGTGDFNPWKGYSGTNLENAHGYAYYYYETTIPFKGKINVDDYSVTLRMYNGGDLNFQGWNMAGNPYTSILDWDVAVSDGAIPTGAENAIYFFDDDAGDGAQSNYRYYVPSTGGTYGIGTEDANGKIPLGQAFFVKTNTDNVTLNLKKNYRIHAVQEFYKTTDNDYIKLQITGSKSDETIVRIVDNSTMGFDVQFDARKLFPTDLTIPQLYIIGNDGIYTAINSFPDIEENTIIKLGINAEAGEYNISLKDLNFIKYDVFLVDEETNTKVNLNNIETYHFSCSDGQNNKRFYLTFKSSASDINSNLSNNINIYPNPTSQYIKFENNSNTRFESIRIISTNGKTCYFNNNPESINEIDLSQFTDGIYFIEIKLSDGNIYRNKIILKK